MTAAVGEHTNLRAVADHEQRNLTVHAPGDVVLLELAERGQVVPARLDQVRDLFGMVGTVGLPERDMAAAARFVTVANSAAWWAAPVAMWFRLFVPLNGMRSSGTDFSL